MKKYFWTIVSSVLILQTVQAQSDLSSLTMWKSVNTVFQNPSLFPEDKVVVALPHVFVGGATDNISVSDILDKSPNDWLNNLADQNKATIESNIQTLGVYLKFGKLSVGIQHGMRSNLYFQYPKALLDLAWNGNSKFIGKTIDIAPSIEAISVSEFGLSLGYELKNIKLGGRVKYLNGLANISPTSSKLNLTTSDDIYQLTIDADYGLQSSSILSWNTIDSFDLSFTELQAQKLFSKNNGLSFDLGASIKIGEKLTIAASVNDIGSINWKDNAKTFTSKGNFTYNGLALDEVFKKDSSISFSNVIDSVKNSFKVQEQAVSYTKAVGARYNLMAHFDITSKFGVTGAVWYRPVNENFILSSFMVGANYALTSWWQVGGSYVVYTGNPFNIGVSTLMNIGPVQLLLATDNITTFFKPQSSKYGNIKAGLALVF